MNVLINLETLLCLLLFKSRVNAFSQDCEDTLATFLIKGWGIGPIQKEVFGIMFLCKKLNIKYPQKIRYTSGRW